MGEERQKNFKKKEGGGKKKKKKKKRGFPAKTLRLTISPIRKCGGRGKEIKGTRGKKKTNP